MRSAAGALDLSISGVGDDRRLATSAGVGDRLGLATPGHVRAFREHGAGIVPVFAQQSIRERDRLNRTPQ